MNTRHHNSDAPASGEDAAQPRPSGSVYMGGFVAPRLERVRFAIVGVGERGGWLANLLAAVDGAEIAAICDLNPEEASAAAADVAGRTGHRPPVFDGEQGYGRLLHECRPDAVVINTPWHLHASMAIEAMEAGAHAFVEVPLALSLTDLWRVVDCAERTRRHCMMMENVNYGREELLFLNMVRQGAIGDVLHGEAAYIHDMREQMKDESRGTVAWRTLHYAHRNGNLYPTHGLGPVAQYMNLARGEDMFGRIVSLGSPALGRAAYARRNFPPGHKWNRLEYCCGDINTSIIRTRLGRNIMLQWDETSPRPYTRHNLIQGTRGVLAGFPTRMAGEFAAGGQAGQDAGPALGCPAEGRGWLQGEEALAAMYERYEHPLYRRLGARAVKVDDKGGMNFIMFARIVECLRRGEPLDQNVYEGALWSAVGALSEQSVAAGGVPQPFPDFTRGMWRATAPLGVVR